jgi:transcription elongation factor GreB
LCICCAQRGQVFWFTVEAAMSLRQGHIHTRDNVRTMSKAFTRENDNASDEDDDDIRLPDLPAGGKNYITAAGYARLRDELMNLIDNERPKIVEIVHWAASNGDRSENGDYIYGKKRLREIDRRIRFLTKRLEIAEVADPSVHHGNEQVFFGATVTYVDMAGDERTVTILGIDEVDTSQGEISWVSPVARTLLKARVGDVLPLVTPAGIDEIEVLQVQYPRPQQQAGSSDPLHS